MIISARHNFVFVKTRKTAGTSIEVFLASCIEPSAVATPINPPEDGHQARNYLADPSSQGSAPRFWNHMPAWQIRDELGAEAWETYRSFCVERNPWDQVISAYSMLRRRGNPHLSWEDYLASGNFFLNHQLYTEPDDPARSSSTMLCSMRNSATACARYSLTSQSDSKGISAYAPRRLPNGPAALSQLV